MWHYLRGPAGGRFRPVRARRVVICLQTAKRLRLVVTDRSRALGAPGVTRRADPLGCHAPARMRRGNGPLPGWGYCDPVPRNGAERITGNQREKGDKLMTPGRITSAHARREGR